MSNKNYLNKNILSYELGTPLKGSEIKEWIAFHLNCKDKTKQKMAHKMRRYLNLKDDSVYYLLKDNNWQSSTYKTYLVKNAALV